MVLAMSTMVRGEALFGRGIEGVIHAVLAATVMFYAGRSVFADAFTQTRHLRANMNSLIALGTLTAFGWSVYAIAHYLTSGAGEHLYFESAAMIITLILLGRFLEARAKGKAGEAIEALLKLQASKNLAVINSVEIDIANHTGTPVIATADGVVRGAGRTTGMGKLVTVDHGYGFKTRYGHLSEIKVKNGQRVKRGDIIALMGSTDYSTGPHLHYEVIRNGKFMSPAKYILNDM